MDIPTRARRSLDGASILPIDDTWATGASIQSADYALKTAGAYRVGVVIIGRQVNPDYDDNTEHLKGLPRPFGWATFASHEQRSG